LDVVVPLELTPTVAADASRIAVEHGLRAYDAVHFASFERLSADGATLVASDGELVRAARAVGYSVAVPGI
jgi:predicted nucleic acid-binding protein